MSVRQGEKKREKPLKHEVGRREKADGRREKADVRRKGNRSMANSEQEECLLSWLP